MLEGTEKKNKENYTPMGPIPGPPPPCGMQNVLCRLRCETSAPMAAGWHSATCSVQR